VDEYTIVAKGNDLVVLFQRNPHLKHDIVTKSFVAKIQFLFYHKVSEVRAVGYRILRYIIVDYESLQIVVKSKILIYIIVTMGSTKSSSVEKEQALKLVRQFVNVENGADNLSIGAIKSLVALIQHENSANEYGLSYEIPESFKSICLETICEISLFKPELVFHSGAFNVMIDKIINGTIEISTSCLLVVFNCLDQPFARRFLRNGYDLILIIDIYSEQGKVSVVKMQRISFLLTCLLKNFNGLMAFLINDFQILKSFLSNLKNRNFKATDYILDVLLDVLRVQDLPWLENSEIYDVIQIFNRAMNGEGLGEETGSERGTKSEQQRGTNHPESNHNLSRIVTHYQGLVTLILINTDLMKYLAQIVEQNLNESNTTKASLLISSIYSTASKLIPPELLKNKTLLPKNPYLILHHHQQKPPKSSVSTTKKPTNNDLETTLRNITITSRYHMSDDDFKTVIFNTKILAIKEFESWNWTQILFLIQGPLTNPKRFDELVEKNPKILKRLLSFYRPFKFRFCNISRKNKLAHSYVNVGCQLMKLLLSLDRGIKYLTTNKILPQLAEIFTQLDPASGITTKDPILSATRLENTVCIGYLKFVGVLSGTSSGLTMLDHWQFFHTLHNIVETGAFSDRNNVMLMNLFNEIDFSMDSQFRIILLKTISVTNAKFRLHIVRELIPKLMAKKDCQHFAVKILFNSLFDGDFDIVTTAIDLLNEHYTNNSFNNMANFIKLRPPIPILSSTVGGRNLLINMLKVPSGFKYLQTTGFIDAEFNRWKTLDNFQYLNKIETIIHGTMFPYVPRNRANVLGPKSNHYMNFFPNLLHTEEGYIYFTNYHQQEYLHQLMAPITEFSQKLKTDDDSVYSLLNDNLFNKQNIVMINTIKQNLWIIGNIASGKYGIQLLDPMSNNVNTNIISVIIDLFYTCPIWQIRGLCFYVLGMMTATIEGIEILDEVNWISVLDQYGNSKQVVYPKNFHTLFNVEIYNPYEDIKHFSIFNGQSKDANDSFINDESDSDEYLYFDDSQKLTDRIIALINNLNSVLGKVQRKSIKELTKLKKNMPGIFKDNVQLFLEIIKVIDKGNFNFETRNFVFGLFVDGSRVLELLVKRDRRHLTV
jgi:hypothetical protein